MERAAEYGGNGMIKRSEYAPLTRERQAGLFFDASLALDPLLEGWQDGAQRHVSVDKSTLERTAYMEHDVLDGMRIDALVADTATGTVYRMRERMHEPIHKEVYVYHSMHRDSQELLEEEYRLTVHSAIAGTTGTFFTHYTFLRYRGGVVSAQIELNDVTVDGTAPGGALLTREMTEFDVGLFEKDMAEIGAWVRSAPEDIVR